MKHRRLVNCLVLVAMVLAASVAYAAYDRTYNANSYHIYSTLRTKTTATRYMTNDNDICRRTSDNSEASYYTNAWSEGNNRATETAYGVHAETVTANYYDGFGAIDAKYKLEMGNPNNFEVHMVGDWTPN
jgi:hypothetical protein